MRAAMPGHACSASAPAPAPGFTAFEAADTGVAAVAAVPRGEAPATEGAAPANGTRIQGQFCGAVPGRRRLALHGRPAGG